MPVLKSLNYDLQHNEELKGRFAPLAVEMVHMDVSEDNSFMKRFNIRMIPMYLVCHKGKLVYASNAMSLRNDFIKEMGVAVEQAKRGDTRAAVSVRDVNQARIAKGMTRAAPSTRKRDCYRAFVRPRW